jgi:hypothetical protein
VNPVVNVDTVQEPGDVPGMISETDPPTLAVQMFDPSKAIPKGDTPRLVEIVVTAPGGWEGSIR